MAEEKMRILKMLSEGKISPEEAEKLLNAVETGSDIPGSGKSLLSAMENKYLYVQVEPKEGKSAERVSVKVPFALMKAGLNIAGLIPKEAKDKINSSMQDKGIDFDLQNLDPANIQEIMTALEELTVDVDTDDSTIKVYCR
ncbi:MAG: hypothetical protein JEZ04_05850 [Spirochaetales bacterium]|nr:hypothetical protein [Spirochaetales bacterium]